MPEIRGICAALCSPFDDSGERLDEGRFTSLIDELLAAGMHGFVFCSGTGEFAYLRPVERRRMIEIGCRHVGERAAKIAHVSTMNSADGIELARHAEDAGADGLMILPPYFEGPGEAGVLRFYEAIGEAVSVEIVVYNIPAHSGFDITPRIFRRLLEIENVNYIKDSTGDLVRIQELVATGAKIFNGADPLAFYSLLAGCHGCIWGAANVMPRETVRLYELISAGNYAEALALWKRMAPANIHFWNNPYIPTVKAATNLQGRTVGPCRQPIQPLGADELSALRVALAALRR